MKDIKFSRVFPVTHPRAGQSTYFVEKIWRHFFHQSENMYENMHAYLDEYDGVLWDSCRVAFVNPKLHTIRAGHRFEAGEQFAPKVWADKPYRSHPIQFAPAITVEKTFDFNIKDGAGYLNGLCVTGYKRIAENDGLDGMDFAYWFRMFDTKVPDFSGQIICWDNKLLY